MRKIWKFPLAIEYRDGHGAMWDPTQYIEMPAGAKILSVGLQYGHNAVLWALVNPEVSKEMRRVYVVGTGAELENNVSDKRFVGTLIFGEGGIVLHVFE